MNISPGIDNVEDTPGQSRPPKRIAQPGQPLLKICGITSPSAAEHAFGAGADYVGVLVEVERSPRSVDMDTARQIFGRLRQAGEVRCIAVAFNPTPELVRRIAIALRPDAIQMAGTESVDYVGELQRNLPEVEFWKSLHFEGGIPAPGHEDRQSEEVLAVAADYVAAGVRCFVLDTKSGQSLGGTGMTHDWSLSQAVVAGLKRRWPGVRVLLAGGITPDNAADAFRSVKPDGLDVSSGLETQLGVKDAELVHRLVDSVRPVGRG